MQKIGIKRVYEPAEPSDGYRVLVDKLWPRGMNKERLHYDLWAKELAPSAPLRAWFHAAPENAGTLFANGISKSSNVRPPCRSSPKKRAARKSLRSSTLRGTQRPTTHGSCGTISRIFPTDAAALRTGHNSGIGPNQPAVTSSRDGIG